MFLLMIDPDSFDIRNFNPEMVSIDMIYFSFTTLTTLGYGDITPVSYTAKMWSIINKNIKSKYQKIPTRK